MNFSNFKAILVKSLVFGLLTLVALFIWLKDYPLDLPFSDSPDVFFGLAFIKSLAQGEWNPFEITHLRFWGAPFGSTLSDFPHSDHLNFIILKVFSFFSGNPVLIYNLFYLLGFSLCAATCLILCLFLEIPLILSLALSTLFAFLPYHFYRYPHLFLSAYYLVPLQTLVLLSGFNSRKTGGFSVHRGLLGGILIATAWSGIYYAFFFCFLLMVRGLMDSLSNKTIRGIKRSTLAILAVVFFILIGSTNYIRNYVVRGRNHEVAHRSPIEAELYGLKLNNLVIPNENHRLYWFRKLNSKFQSIIPRNEGSVGGYIGIIPILGLVLIFFYFLGLRGATITEGDVLVVLAGSSFLLSTVGGLGALFNFWVSPMIRCYNRMSPYLALFGLLSVGIFCKKTLGSKNNLSVLLFSLTIFLVGVLDQTPKASEWLFNNKAQRLAERSAYQKFIKTIQVSLPSQGNIFTLPFMSFPENGPINQMDDYSFFRLGLWSNHLRWSYGAVRGRHGAEKLKTLSNFPVVIDNLVKAGFQGVCIDRNGYEDRGTAFENLFRSQLKTSPVQSEDGRYVFFHF